VVRRKFPSCRQSLYSQPYLCIVIGLKIVDFFMHLAPSAWGIYGPEAVVVADTTFLVAK